MEPESSDPSDGNYSPTEDAGEDAGAATEQFVEDWVLSLNRHDTISLALFLTFHLLNFPSTRAAEYAAIMIGKSDRTVRQWRADFHENQAIPDSQQGRYQRSGVLWSSEALNTKATWHVRENVIVKGRPNLTTHSFCRWVMWVNVELLPNEILEPGFPRKVSVETARRWLHELGFEPLASGKGMFFVGHERDDVVLARGMFLSKMAESGFLHPDHAPTPEAARAFPVSIPLPSTERREKTVVLFHDESTFQANDDQTTMWGKKGEHMLPAKSKGSGIMVSDFVDERCSYLALTDEEFSRARVTHPGIRQQARQFLEYGESREGYWTSEKFMRQIDIAVGIAEVKYPKEDGWRHYWVFDQSSCHKAMADDALDASRMNVNPGGKQPLMRDTVWALPWKRIQPKVSSSHPLTFPQI